MARQARFMIENGIYHILSRGHNRQEVFHDNLDFEKYLALLLKLKKMYHIRVCHYILMTNHAHLILESPNGGSLSKAMRGINQGYAQYYRRKYGGCGYLWQDRFKIQHGKYLLECGIYVELNPVMAKMVKKPEEYRWSSYRVYAMQEQNALVDVSPEYLGLSDNSEERVKVYVGLGYRRRGKRSDFSRMGLMEARNLSSG